MVTNKKAQGLPLHLIVVAAIAALVLVLIIAFTIGGLGTFFTKIFGGGKVAVGEELDVVRTTCGGLCDTAKGSLTLTAWKASSYCNREFNIDLDKDGVLGCPGPLEGEGAVETGECEDAATGLKDKNRNLGGDLEIGLHCYDDPIKVDCSTVIAGESVSKC